MPPIRLKRSRLLKKGTKRMMSHREQAAEHQRIDRRGEEDDEEGDQPQGMKAVCMTIVTYIGIMNIAVNPYS